MNWKNTLRILLKYFVYNLLWLLFNFPLFIVLFTFPYIKTSGELLTNLIILIPLLSLLFFPSTTALYGVIKKDREANDKIDGFLTFFSLLKKNYVKSMLGGFIFSLLWTVSFSLLYISVIERQLILSFLAFIVFAFLILIGIYFIILTYQTTDSFGMKFKQSIQWVKDSPKQSMLLISSITLIAMVTLTFLQILIPTCLASLIMGISYQLTKDY